MSVFDFDAQALDGSDAPLSAYRGQVLLIVNTASKCGFTPQYEGLEALHRKYKERGFSVLGFPCNQFGAQEPGAASEIATFCEMTYGVSFPMFAKIDVNGPNAHPLYQYLATQKRGFLGARKIRWNFTKFLCDREGAVRRRYPPIAEPATLEGAVAALL
jgi:glutathione peroxidase